MNINKIGTNIGSSIKNKATKFFTKTDSFGEGVNITMDFLGKAAVTPALILLNPFSKDDKENKKFAAIKNPVGATIQLACEVPLLFGVSKLVQKAANKGVFDKQGSDFSYDTKTAKDAFVRNIKENCTDSEKIKPLLEELEQKGLSRKLAIDFTSAIKSMPNTTKQMLTNLVNTDKRLYHLSNRMVFLTAVLATPVICALESKVHTHLTNKMSEKEAKNA